MMKVPRKRKMPRKMGARPQGCGLGEEAARAKGSSEPKRDPAGQWCPARARLQVAQPPAAQLEPETRPAPLPPTSSVQAGACLGAATEAPLADASTAASASASSDVPLLALVRAPAAFPTGPVWDWDSLGDSAGDAAMGGEGGGHGCA